MGGSFKAVGVLTTDRDLIVTSWDRWLADATGIASESAAGRSLFELVPDLADRGLLARLLRVLQDGTVAVLAPAFHRFLIRCPPREPISQFEAMQQHVIIAPLREGRSVLGLVITIEDVTARLERERELAAQLRHGDEAIRLRAARALAEDSSHDVLMDAFSDPDWPIRKAAVEGFRRATGEEAAAALTRALHDQHRDFSVLNATLSALAVAGGDVVPGLVEALASNDVDVRIYAALTLGYLEDDRVPQALLDALGDPETNVRYHAIEALGRRRATAAADRLAEVALSEDFYLAFAALDALARIGESSVAPRLLPLLENPMLAAAATETLGALGTEDAVAPVAVVLEDPEIPVTVVAGALATLHARFEAEYGEGELVAQLARGAIGPAGARRLVGALAGATDAQLAQLAIVLGWLQFDGMTRALAGLLAHPRARPLALEALVRRGRPAVGVLIDELRSPSPDVQKGAASALGRIGSPLAVPALVELLDGPADLAVVAAGALGSIGDASAFEPLLPLLARDESTVRQAAASALNSLGHPEMQERVRHMLEDPSPYVRESGARIAGYFGYDNCLAAMLRLCADPDVAVRRVAVEHMAFFRDARASDAVVGALSDPAAQVRAAAARALAHLQGASVVSALTGALDDADPWVRYYSARSSRWHRAPQLVNPLCRVATSDPAPPVRIAALEALGQLGDVRAVEPLAAVARQKELDLARPALESLGRIGTREVVPHFQAALDHPDAAHRLAALHGLARSPSAATLLEEVRRQAESGDAELTFAATEVLVQIGTVDAVGALLELARDPTRRGLSVAALARVREEMLDAVAGGLRHEDERVRGAVVEALARRKQPNATRLLANALADPDAGVRLAAERALSRTDLRAAEQRSPTADFSAIRRPSRDAFVR